MGATDVCHGCGARTPGAARSCWSCGRPLSRSWDLSSPDHDLIDDAPDPADPDARSAFDEEFDPSLEAGPAFRSTSGGGTAPAPPSVATAPSANGRPARREDEVVPAPPGVVRRAVSPEARDGFTAGRAPAVRPPVGQPPVAKPPGAAPPRARPADAGPPARSPAPRPQPIVAARSPEQAPAGEVKRARDPAPPRRAPPAPGMVERGQVACRSCGTGNAPQRRFCRRCGSPLAASVVDARRRPQERGSWWQRHFGDPEHRAAHRAYRRALSRRSRLLRGAAGLTVVAIVAAALGIGGLRPLPWLRDRWNEYRPDRFAAVEEVLATTAPATAEEPQFAADFAVDKDPLNAWATIWDGEHTPSVEGGADCDPASRELARGALRLTLLEPTDLTRVSIGAGLPPSDDERNAQWRPSAAELVFSDGSCIRQPLADTADLQNVDVTVPAAEWVELYVVAARQPEVGEDLHVAVHAVELFTHHGSPWSETGGP